MVDAGLLILDKPAGLTSFGAVQRIRSLTGAKRVGHAGTLDPLATGVLPILMGSATRLSDYALRQVKTYVADVHFGHTTETDDAEGQLVAVADPSDLDRERVAAALQGFVGRIMQAPPAYSAIKLGGERAYRLARQGRPVRPEARPVDVHEATLLSFEPGPAARASLKVVCGSGTYLRSLARDLGDVLEVGAYLGKLVRTAYGGLTIEEAVRLDDLVDGEAVRRALRPPELVLPHMHAVRVTVEQVAQIKQGRAVRVFPEPGPGEVRAHDADGRLVALGHTDPLLRTFVPEKVLV